MLKNKFVSFVLFVSVTYMASFIGSVSTLSSKEPWYSALNKSFLTPPDWVFAPVWTTLYLLMSIAIWNAWHKNNRNINLIYIYLIHLFFNTTWSIVFFVYHNISVALINLIIIILFRYVSMEAIGIKHDPVHYDFDRTLNFNFNEFSFLALY